MREPKVGQPVIFFPAPLDREARENGVNEVAGIICQVFPNDQDSINVRIFNHSTAGLVPLRQYVLHIDAANGIAPYWKYPHEEKAVKAEPDMNAEPKVITPSEYTAANTKFTQLYAQWNAMSVENQASESGKNLSNKLDELHGIITQYEINNPPADAPVADAPVADAPIADAPVADAPVADAPVADAPVADAPVADAPVADAPVADAPVADAPVADAATANKKSE